MYEIMTKHIESLSALEEEGDEHSEDRGQGAVDAFVRDFYASGLDDHDYIGTLQRAGINTESADPASYPFDEMDGAKVIALLTAIVRSERFCEGSLLEAVRSGLVRACLERLEEIDFESRELSERVIAATRAVLSVLARMPDGAESSVCSALREAYPDESTGEIAHADGGVLYGYGDHTFSTQEMFDITEACFRYESDFGLRLEGAGGVMGLPFMTGLRVCRLCTEGQTEDPNGAVSPSR